MVDTGMKDMLFFGKRAEGIVLKYNTFFNREALCPEIVEKML